MSSTQVAKKSGRKATTAAAPAPVAVASVVATPAKASKSTKAEAAPVAVAAPAVVEPVVASTASSEENVNVVSQFNTIVESVNKLRSTLSSLHSDMKKLEKQIPRELKKAQKGRRRKAVAVDGEDKPKKDTVFTKPTPISDALCTFLGLAKGTLLSRSEVTTRVCRYAKENSLMVKQVIKADAPLRKLLALTEADELKILNLQRYLKPHYIKNTIVATA